MKKIHIYTENYLFRTHPKRTIRNWLNSLKYFYFNRAWGGHANDGDEFVAFFQIKSKEHLKILANKIGFKLELLSNNNPTPIKGKSYTSIEYNKFKTPIKNYPKFKQPGRIEINGIESFLWIDNNDILKISLSGSSDKNYYEVSELDFRNSKKLEIWFRNNGLMRWS